MPRQSDDEECQLPSDLDYVTLPTDRRNCGADRVSFNGEGSSSIPSPVKEINFKKWGRAQVPFGLGYSCTLWSALGPACSGP
jgi:hypothetical protein